MAACADLEILKAAVALASHYSAIANAVTAFHIAQGLLFLNQFYKEGRLARAVERARLKFVIGTILIGAMYLAAIVFLGHLEVDAYGLGSNTGLNGFGRLSCEMMWGRAAVVVFGTAMTVLILGWIKDREAQAPSAT